MKERFGHAGVTTTIDRYGYMFPSVEASLADALDGMYEGPDQGPADNVEQLRPSAAELDERRDAAL